MRTYYDVNRIYKNKYNKKISGVCSGLARYWKVDAWMVRLAAIVAFFMLPGAMAIAYLVAVLLLPSR